MLTATEGDDVDEGREAQIQSISELIATLWKGFDGVGETLLATGEDLLREYDTLRDEYATLEERSGVELLVAECEYRELDEKHRSVDLERVKLSKRLAAMETKYKYETLKTHEVEEKCAAAEVRAESAEAKWREVEEKLALEVSAKAKIEKDHRFVMDCYQVEKNERVMVEERCKEMEEKHEVEVEERRRVQRSSAELEERHELERLERLNVEHELKVLGGKHGVVVEELRRFEEKCGELEGKNEILMLEKMNAEDECRGIEEKMRLEVEGRRKIEKEYAELWEKHKLELLEKVKIQIMYKELDEKYRKDEKEYRVVDEKHDLDMLEMMKLEKECKEVAEKYRVEVMNRRKVEEKYNDLEKKYTDAIMEVLKEHSAIHENYKFEQQEKIKLKREYEELKEKIKGLQRGQESKEGEEKAMFEKKYVALQEMYEFEKLENLKIQNEYKEHLERHRLEISAKIKAENDLKECQSLLEGLKEEILVASGRCDRLLEEVRKGFKAEDHRSDMNHREISEHVMNIEDLPASMPAIEASTGNGGLHISGTQVFSSGSLILISDSDEDCSTGEKKQMGLKRKRGLSPNNTNNSDRADNLEQDTTPTADMRQHQKLRRCDSLVNYLSKTIAASAVSDYGNQNNSSSYGHIVLGTKEKVRGPHKLQTVSPAMASVAPIDCESDDDFSSDDSEDEHGLQSLLSAVVGKAKAREGKSFEFRGGDED